MKQNALLEVKNLHVSAEDETEILHGVNLTLGRDETHVMENGVIVKEGGASLVEEINEHGFGKLSEDR